MSESSQAVPNFRVRKAAGLSCTTAYVEEPYQVPLTALDTECDTESATWQSGCYQGS